MIPPYVLRRGPAFALYRPTECAQDAERPWDGRPAHPPFLTGTLEEIERHLGCAGLTEAESGRLRELIRRHRFPPQSVCIGERRFSLLKPVLMGIVNVTPDSFSDGGQFLNPATAVAHALKLVEEGARIIDIGGESTRPGAEGVSVEEELSRVLPVIRGIRASSPVALSIDTTKAAVAEEALKAGAGMVNDISALHFEPDLAETAARHGASIALMHIQGTPRVMQRDPVYLDLPGEILAFLREGVERALAAGIPGERILVDPGIGFGKRACDNFWILENLEFMKGLGCPVLVGASRKSFLASILDRPPVDRLFGTLAAHARAREGGARVFRVHDAAAHADFFKTAESFAHESLD